MLGLVFSMKRMGFCQPRYVKITKQSFVNRWNVGADLDRNSCVTSTGFVVRDRIQPRFREIRKEVQRKEWGSRYRKQQSSSTFSMFIHVHLNCCERFSSSILMPKFPPWEKIPQRTWVPICWPCGLNGFHWSHWDPNVGVFVGWPKACEQPRDFTHFTHFFLIYHETQQCLALVYCNFMYFAVYCIADILVAWKSTH